jgi:hypothetical protein
MNKPFRWWAIGLVVFTGVYLKIAGRKELAEVVDG